ncbi:MAG TPA: hypothetical protein VFZ65_19275 [Planctomycetota bacterium]|nr:hypothetical protein [Planctomycetota bacterium]
MRIDLGMVAELGAEMGFAVRDVPPDEIDLVLEPDVVLVFQNLPGPSDSLVGFEGCGWHFHGDLQCSDKRGNFVELSYLDIITGLADGTVLMCECVVDGLPRDRWLVHRDYVDEFRHMEAGEEIRVRRINVGGCTAGREVPADAAADRGERPKERSRLRVKDVMRAKPIVEIDGGSLRTLEDFAAAFRRAALVDCEWHGSLDAFDDILRGGFGTPEGGFVLRWINSDASRKHLGYLETVRQLQRRLQTCDSSNRHRVEQELRAATAGTGPTVFDWLVEIIEDHGAGGRQADDGVELELR